MNVFAWGLSVLFVGLVFGLVLIFAGGVLINVYFDTRERREKAKAEALAESFTKISECLAKMKEESGEEEN